ncbi:hypothetical protein AOE01nite_06880 [Acetobacter oeni]|uniref:ATP-grasp domain-containing protein n=1 Tax=Acetobacter oeni TaxID=304077 RepID=A0A511XHP3_9PROT|nr:hypothetical protein AOE01nite_06880 [Acetobacter oeni]
MAAGDSLSSASDNRPAVSGLSSPGPSAGFPPLPRRNEGPAGSGAWRGAGPLGAVSGLLKRDEEKEPVSFFEFWPGWLFYTPIVAYWIALGIWYRDFGMPTAANPKITTGGLCCESKSAILDMAGPVAREAIAPYIVLDTDTDDLARARAALSAAGIALPVVVKPDIGCNGTGVKLTETAGALAAALASFPRGVRLVIQRLIPWEHEAGLFYIRHANEACGRISSVTYKDVPALTGDGKSTVDELLLADPRTRLVPQIYRPRLAGRLNDVLPAGEQLPLVFTGNHCKGSVFRNGADDVTPELTAAVDRIMRDIPEFHFGRVDLKFRSVEALRAGKDFEIIEINGVGSEATHIWDSRTTLREAYATQFHHYGEAFRIGAENRRRGWKSTRLFYGIRLWREQRRLMRSYPLND